MALASCTVWGVCPSWHVLMLLFPGGRWQHGSGIRRMYWVSSLYSWVARPPGSSWASSAMMMIDEGWMEELLWGRGDRRIWCWCGRMEKSHVEHLPRLPPNLSPILALWMAIRTSHVNPTSGTAARAAPGLKWGSICQFLREMWCKLAFSNKYPVPCGIYSKHYVDGVSLLQSFVNAISLF